VELQAHMEEFRKRGLNVAAVSYDSPQVLSNFATRRNIRFPLLSDAESRTIRAFGILNESIQKDSFVYGVPYPGTYVLDASGVVTAKYFEEEYAERVTASDILVRQFGATIPTLPAGGSTPAPNRVEGKHLSVTESTSTRYTIGGQKIALILTIEMQPGIHVYAPGVEGYKPVAWEMSPGAAGLPARLFTPVAWPPSKTLHLKAIGESVPVYEKRLRLVREFTVPSDQLLRTATSSDGRIALEGTFRYQACDATTCYNPETLPVHFNIQVLRHDTERVPEELRRKSGVH
jgi:alkyl hydroperoxide reductase subunit AhpC